MRHAPRQQRSLLRALPMSTTGQLLASRVREIRHELFGDGDGGVAALSRAMGVPARTWEHFERGVSLPASILLDFLVHTGAEPRWLLTGEGPRYRARPAEQDRHAAR